MDVVIAVGLAMSVVAFLWAAVAFAEVVADPDMVWWFRGFSAVLFVAAGCAAWAFTFRFLGELRGLL